MSSSTPPVVSGEPAPTRDERSEPLIRAAQDGSSSALGQLLEGTRNYLLMAANRALDADLRAKGGASDLVQETFVEAFRDFSHFTGTSEPQLIAWLLAILDHRLANHVRHYRRTKKRTVDRERSIDDDTGEDRGLRDNQPTPGTAIVDGDEARRVRDALDKMPALLRDVLVERTWQRATFAEVGARRGCSAQVARNLWGRAVRQMKLLLDEIQ